MKLDCRMAARLLVVIALVRSMNACVSPAARVPCDGRLEPINPPAKRAELEGKRLDPAVPKAPP
jgi:hypothetical protein